MSDTFNAIGMLSAIAVLTGLGIGFGALLGGVSERLPWLPPLRRGD